MRHHTPLSREVLRYATRFIGATVFVVPSGIGPITRDDLEMHLDDIKLLLSLGMHVFAVDYAGGEFWSGLEWPDDLQHLFVTDDDDLVTKAWQYGVKKLCLVAGSDHVTIRGVPLDDVPVAKVEDLLTDASLMPGTRHVFELARKACRGGVSRVHVINVHQNGALLDELFTNRGAGTMIYTGKPHKEVRRMDDQDRFSVRTLLYETVPRQTAEFVRAHKAELRVFSVDGDVHGIARVVQRESELLVLTLAHAPRSNIAEVLEQLLRAVIDEARSAGMRRVILPTNTIPALMRILPWFTGLEFVKGRAALGTGQQDAWLREIV